MEHEELGSGGLEGFQVVRRGEDVGRRGEREGDPRRKQSGEDEEEPDGQPDLESRIHDSLPAALFERAQIPHPFPFLLF